MRKDIPHAERTYLVVPYAERNEAKALGARWDAVKKAWYVGPEADRGKSRNGNRNISLRRHWIHGRNSPQCCARSGPLSKASTRS